MTVTPFDTGNTGLTPVNASVTGSTWSATVDVSSLADGLVDFTIKSTNTAGGIATVSTGAEKTIVTITQVTSSIDTTNDTATQISGTVGTGSTVSVVASDGDGHQTGPTSAAVTGNTWSLTGIDVSGFDDGTITYTVTATNPDHSTATATTTSTKSTVTMNSLAAITLANDTAFSIGGSVESGATVSVVASDASGNKTAAIPATIVGNTWSADMDVSALDDGTITFVATATDAGNNKAMALGTAQKTTLSVTPVSPITSQNDTAVQLSGSVEPGSTMTVTAADKDGHALTAVNATVTGNTWSASIDTSTLDDGLVTFTVNSTNSGGGTASVTATAEKTVVTITQVTNPIGTDNDTATQINGTVGTNSTVSVVASDGDGHQTAPTSATVTGTTWSLTGIDVSSFDDGTITYTVTATNPDSATATATITSTKTTVQP